jgi:hypothetical protein
LLPWADDADNLVADVELDDFVVGNLARVRHVDGNLCRLALAAGSGG